MKRSELKDYIKEQIVDILQEASKEDVENQAALNKELEKTNDLMSKMDMKEDEDAEAPAGDKEIEKKASKNDQIIKNYRKIKAQMDTHLAMFKDAEGDKAKKAAMQMLKKLTPDFQAAKKAYDKIKG
jgi:hypothetical protein